MSRKATIDIPESTGRDGAIDHAAKSAVPEDSALAKLESLARAESQEELSREVTDELSRTLGQAVARCWSGLPQEIQQDLFEAAVASEGEAIRHQLAVYLHGKHQRTVGAAQARAMPEPDSLGG
jgi:hypothetical protein